MHAIYGLNVHGNKAGVFEDELKRTVGSGLGKRAFVILDNQGAFPRNHSVNNRTVVKRK